MSGGSNRNTCDPIGFSYASAIGVPYLFNATLVISYRPILPSRYKIKL
jgi:hypothetical protein